MATLMDNPGSYKYCKTIAWLYDVLQVVLALYIGAVRFGL